MADIFDFGLQKYNLRLKGGYQNNVFAVVGDTARRIEVQLTAPSGAIVDTTGISLRLSTVVGETATYVDATVVDAAIGLYQVDLTSGLLLHPGVQEFQWSVYDTGGAVVHSFPFKGKVGKNITVGGTQSYNFYLKYDELQDKIDELDALELRVDTAIAGATTDTEVIDARDGHATLGDRLEGVDAQLAEKVKKKELTLNVKDFGAKGDGVTDDTQAFNDALAYYSKMSPEYFSGWGIGEIFIPRGNYLINGTITRTSPIGVVFRGESEYATNIIRTVDTGTLFYLRTYISVAFEKMAIIHKPQGERSTWTALLFELDGTGGGKMLQLRNVVTKNFHTVVKHTNTINEDTNNFYRCRFIDCTTFLDSENSQAVVNTYSNCAWGGAIQQVFHVAGQQNTLIESGNIICEGTFIKYKSIANKYNDRGFTLLNCKLEWTTNNEVANSTPKLIDAQGDYISSNVTMIDCTIDGGSTPAPDAMWANINSQCRIRVIGGTLTGKLKIKSNTRPYPERGNYILFENIGITPDNIIFDTNGSTNDDVFPSISFENCRGIGHNPINLTLTKGFGTPSVKPSRTVVLGVPNSARPVFYPSSTTQVNMSTFGQAILIKNIKVNFKSTTSAAGTINVYSDSARTNLIATLSIPTGSKSNNVFDIPLTGSNVVTNEGVFIDYINTGATTTAVFICDYVSI